MKKFRVILLSMALLLCACAPAESVRQIFLMDTIINISVSGNGAEQVMDEIESEFIAIDELCSPGMENSMVSALNNAGKVGMEISPELYEILSESVDISLETQGAFDVSLGALIELWNVGGESPSVPSADAVNNARKLCGMDKLVLSESYAAADNIKLNLGGIAKGYAAKRTMNILSEKEVASALVYIGGNICVQGVKPDGTPWNIGIRDPEGTASDYIGILQLSDTVVSASGDYERYFEKDGVRYHHIIDPSTGYPAKSGLASVTVVCEDGVRADALSTALFVMGKEKALDFWKKSNDFECVIIDENMNVIVTDGLKDKCRVTDGGYSLEIAYR